MEILYSYRTISVCQTDKMGLSCVLLKCWWSPTRNSISPDFPGGSFDFIGIKKYCLGVLQIRFGTPKVPGKSRKGRER